MKLEENGIKLKPSDNRIFIGGCTSIDSFNEVVKKIGKIITVVEHKISNVMILLDLKFNLDLKSLSTHTKHLYFIDHLNNVRFMFDNYSVTAYKNGKVFVYEMKDIETIENYVNKLKSFITTYKA